MRRIFSRDMHAVLIGLFFVLLIVTLLKPIVNFDILWHLQTGKHICENTFVPENDFFSYTAIGRQWLEMSWGFQAAAYTLYSVFGAGGLVIVKTVIAVLSFFLLFFTGYNRKTFLLSMTVMLLVFCAAHARFRVRPEVVSYFFVSAYLYLLHLFQRSKNRKILWCLPVLQIVWSNAHGLFILGVCLVGSYLCAQCIECVFFKDLRRCKLYDLIHIAIVCAATMLATVCTPYGIAGSLFPLELFRGISGESNSFTYIGELQPLFQTLGISPAWISFYVVVFLALLSFFVNRRRMQIWYVILFCAFLFLAIQAVRNVALCAIVLGCITVNNFNMYIFAGSGKKERPFQYQGMLLRAIAIVLAVSMSMACAHELRAWDGQLGFKEGIYPTAVMKFINDSKIPGNIFNFGLEIGDAFIWHCWPERKVFADGRLQVYDEPFFNAYLESIADDESWNKTVEKYDINYVVLNHTRRKHLVGALLGRRFESFLLRMRKSDMWQCVYVDAMCVVFVKNEERNKNYLTTYQIADTAIVDTAILSSGDLAEESYCRLSELFMYWQEIEHARAIALRGRAVYPKSMMLHQSLLNTYILEEDFQTAKDIISKMLSLNPRYLPAFATLGEISFHEGHYGEALKMFHRVYRQGLRSSLNAYFIAECHRKVGEKKQAMRWYKKVLRKNPDDVFAYNNLGALYAEKGDYERAKNYWEKALQYDPENRAAVQNLERLAG